MRPISRHRQLSAIAIAAIALAMPASARAARYVLHPVRQHGHMLVFKLPAFDASQVHGAALELASRSSLVPARALRRALRTGTLRVRDPWARARRRRRKLPALVLTLAGGGLPPAGQTPLASGRPQPAFGSDPGPALPASDGPFIDPWYQTSLAFGDTSHWLQPWRGYLETVPATRLQSAIGINFNVPPPEADATARALAESGVRRARIEVGWHLIDYNDPGHITADSDLVTGLQALERYGIRPLILLNSNHGMPCPGRGLRLGVTAPVGRGSTQVHLDPASASQVIAGRTGLNSLDGQAKAAKYLFTSVSSDGTATLSQPLDQDLAAGTYAGTTLRYAPFTRPLEADGAPNPAFEQTVGGWLDYANTVTARVKAIMGNDQFDVEIWNELSFGSDFLDVNTYYNPPVDNGTGSTTDAILARTVADLRDPARGLPDVAIGDGFANQTPFAAGSTSPAGLTAIDKHPYPPLLRFPQSYSPSYMRPLDASGHPDGRPDQSGIWHGAFVPSYTSYFPEFFLSAIQTESLTRDLSPITSYIGGVAHGRNTQPPGGAPPTMWFTETNVDPGVRPGLSAAAAREVQAKSVLRSLVSYVNKGVSAIDFYGAKGGSYGLIDSRFFDQLDTGGGYPGLGAAGQTLGALHRLAGALNGAQQIASPRALTLLGVTEPGGHVQFEGDGTGAHPPLYDSEVLGFFPYQLTASSFVVPAYVMTRDVTAVLPPEAFKLRIGGVDGLDAHVSATDPLAGTGVPVQILARDSRSITISLPLTDSPRLIALDEGGAALHAASRRRKRCRAKHASARHARCRAHTRHRARKRRHRG